MDANTLRRAMQPSYIDDQNWARYVDVFNEALIAAECTTVRRVAAFCSQLGHESGGLRYFRELGTTETPSWSWERNRYRGRGPIQLTWRSGYAKFGAWCASKGLVDDPNLFVNSPEVVEQPRWGFLAASHYWLYGGPRPGEINAFADAGNILNVSRCVNGWVTTPNGMTDRTQRWNNCLDIGAALLTEEIDMAAKDDIINFVREYLGPVISDVKDIRQQLVGSRDLVRKKDGSIDWRASFPGWKQLGQNDKGEDYTVVDSLGDTRRRVIALEEQLRAKGVIK